MSDGERPSESKGTHIREANSKPAVPKNTKRVYAKMKPGASVDDIATALADALMGAGTD